MKEYSEDKGKLSTYVPYICLIDKGVVLNRNGTFQKTLKYRGHDLDSSTVNELQNINSRLNDIIKRFNGEWSIFVEARRVKSSNYITVTTDYTAVNIIEEERRKNFFEKKHFESEYYLTFVKLIPTDNNEKITNFFLDFSNKQTFLDKTLSDFNKEFKQIFNLLETIFLEIKELDDDETYSYLHSCVSTKTNNIKVPEVPYAISNYICDSDLLGGLKPKLGNKELRCLSIKGFPNYTIPGFFDKLNRLNIEYRWITRFISLSKLEAISKMEKKYKNVFSSRVSLLQRVMEQLTGDAIQERNMNQDALEKADDIKGQIALTNGDYVSQGFYTCTIIVTGDTTQEVDEKIEKLQKTIDSMGFITINESINCIQAFLGTIPGNLNNNIRKPILNSITLSHLLPISSVWGGDEKNYHFNAPPLIYTTTKGSTPFRFNLHVKDIGHTSIVGPTGSGKSVFLGLIASSFLKYKNAKVFFFDKDASSRVLTYCIGGQFNDIGTDNLSFQPLKEIGIVADNINKEIEKLKNSNTDISEEIIKTINENEKKRANIEREWSNEWILDILYQENITPSPIQKEKIWKTLEMLSEAPENLRTISNLYNSLNDREIKEALIPYKLGGALGKYFDSDNENLTFSSWQVFEMNQIINNKSAITPLLSYIFRKIENSLDGSPVLIILDECWMFFDNKQFANKIRDWLKTLRKKNASVIFATQELNDIMNSMLFTTILDACKTKVFLPNANAKAENYIPIYEKFGLNKTEIEIIANGIPKRQYYYKSEKGSRLFELGLAEKTLKLIASSDKESQNKAKELIKQCSSTNDFITLWIKE